ncbi:hypothetical protein VTN96DRAFT_2307 [Rasamsonia emersonii]|uniref:DUF7732 domain-containing protein n=1 Tax=Rasamsonia emersonii (strain ATCC 16479 / CBS 393.64 / IMI 116815) TaxID=1408163 RepID=A0A0F4Z5Z2_RASE3|nr:hypothetical protein T310_0036 [Rasamsonia emersonii CBS 393.64]KKA25922.1 hypothetical protein T310_0036 [Rasamsonia emersonii CBS 393.64]
MRISLATSLLLLTSLATSRAIPRSDVVAGDVEAVPVTNDAFDLPDLEKRRGGGGGKGGSGGGSGGRSGGGGSGSSSSSSGSSRGSSGSGGSSGSSSSSSSSSRSNVGGFTKTGSGTPRTYGGGSYYAGGASVPYTAGAKSPLGVTPYLLPLGALAVISTLWLYDAYAYPWSRPYQYHNLTTNTDETLPVVCLCQEYSECGCDNNNNSTYVDSILGNNPTNSSVVWIATVNGTRTIFINGTLANGTTAADPSVSAAPAVRIMRWSRYWAIVAIVSAMVWTL